MFALALALWFVDYHAMQDGKDLTAKLPLPIGGGAYTTEKACYDALAKGIKYYEKHPPKNIGVTPETVWAGTCMQKPIKTHTLEELNEIHSGHDMTGM